MGASWDLPANLSLTGHTVGFNNARKVEVSSISKSTSISSGSEPHKSMQDLLLNRTTSQQKRVIFETHKFIPSKDNLLIHTLLLLTKQNYHSGTPERIGM